MTTEMAKELASQLSRMAYDLVYSQIKTSEDVDAVAAAMREEWGGPAGDDVHAQIAAAVFVQATYPDEEVVKTVKSFLDGDDD